MNAEARTGSLQRRLLPLLLLGIALHSFVAGVLLIVLSPRDLQAFGFALVGEPFFKAQSGVLHILMAAIYVVGARDPVRHRAFILFAIAVKLTAFVFLALYYLLAGRILTVLLSGIADGLMAAALVVALRLAHPSEQP
jgi:hypothetical protein